MLGQPWRYEGSELPVSFNMLKFCNLPNDIALTRGSTFKLAVRLARSAGDVAQRVPADLTSRAFATLVKKS
jgi:hypothetical protein